MKALLSKISKCAITFFVHHFSTQLAISLVLRPTARVTGEEPPINLNFTLSR